MQNNIHQSCCSIFKTCVILFFQMNKAGVLRKAIEVILKLQNDNARLKQENMALKMAQQKRGMGEFHCKSCLIYIICFASAFMLKFVGN